MFGKLGSLGGLGRLGSLGGSGGGELPTFTFSTETNTLVAAMTAAGSTPNARQQYAINRFFQKIAAFKSKITAYYHPTATEATWLINWMSPGTFNLVKNGAPTFVAYDGVTHAAATAYYDTGISLNAIGQNDHHLGMMARSTALSDNADLGAVNGGGTSGLLICAKRNTDGVAAYRSMSASAVSTATANDYTVGGWRAVNRLNSTTFKDYGLGKNIQSRTVSSVTPASTNTVRILGVSGASVICGRKIGAVSVGVGLTDSEMETYHAAIQTLTDALFYGQPEVNEAGYAPRSVTADLVVYGMTTQGVCAAYEAARRGRTVVMVGGWRDKTLNNLGGMSANGLGKTDFDAPAQLGGLPRWMVKEVHTVDGVSDATLPFAPRTLLRVMRRMLDPAKADGQSVPIYFTNGISSVQKTGTRITSISTTDGRTFTGRYFIDATYEGDMMALAGVTYVTGREASDGVNTINGYRGLLTTGGSNIMQFSKNPDNSPTLYNVDPYITPATPASGLIAGVEADPGLTNGQAVTTTQAYNFRLSLNSIAAYRIPVSATPPDGYSAAEFEALLRLCVLATAGGGSLAAGDLFHLDVIYNNLLDVNNMGGMSTDWIGGSDQYVAATTYAQRETIWKAHEAYIRRLLYFATYESDARLTAAIKTSMLGYGYDALSFLDVADGDSLYWPTQLYVREFRRMVASQVFRGTDLAASDGTTPVSTKTIAVASYAQDSHHGRRFADAATPKIWNEGQIYAAAGGNLYTPVPYEIFVPQAAECTNLAVPFCCSATHQAFGSIRMEFTSGQAAQSLAIAADIAMDNADQNLQDVDYSTLRTAILASNVNTGEISPPLPQLN